MDGTNQTVFVFDGTASSGSATVLQTDTGLNVLQTVSIGAAGGRGIPIHAGIFDNAYFTSEFPDIKGHLLVCGKDSGGTDSPELYQIGFNSRSAILNSSPNGSPLSGLAGGSTECSPVTEVFNTPTSTDWIFFSVTNSGVPSGCGNGGCVMSVNLTAAGSSWPPPAGVANSAPASGGTSGITFDNVANTTTFPQASSIYFSYLMNVGGGGAINVNNSDFLNPPCNAIDHSGSGCNSTTDFTGGPVYWDPSTVSAWNFTSAGLLSADPNIVAAPPDGSNQVGYASNGGWFDQVLDGNCGGVSCPGGNGNIMLAAGTTYVATVNVGSRIDLGAATGCIYIQANTGGAFGANTSLVNSCAALLGGGQWATATVSYTVPSGSPNIGQHLAIGILTTSGTQAVFNNVLVAVPTGSCNGAAGVGCDVKLTQATLQ